jgi:hypothetical protein
MSQLGEAAAPSEILEALKTECPFLWDLESEAYEATEEKLSIDDDPAHYTETILVVKDGRYLSSVTDAAKLLKTSETLKYSIQKNNGNKLRENMMNGEPGDPKAWNQQGEKKDPETPIAHFISPKATKFCSAQQPVDTKNPSGITPEAVQMMVNVQWNEDGRIISRDYPYTVAAHHCIPGNESLNESELFQQFMQEGGSFSLKIAGKLKIMTTNNNIGYDVNGAHNGVFLPGSYAMNAANAPAGEISWTKRTHPWQWAYITAVAAITKAQFHDRHTGYSEDVLESFLNGYSRAIAAHLEKALNGECPHCKDKFGSGKEIKIPPPYKLLRMLFVTSQWLRKHLTGDPNEWMRPFVASDKFRKDGTRAMTENEFQKWVQDVKENDNFPKKST